MANFMCTVANYLKVYLLKMVTVSAGHGKTRIALATCFFYQENKVNLQNFYRFPKSNNESQRDYNLREC